MNKIKFLRESKGLTQQSLADHLGLGRSTVAMYETDKTEPDFSTLIKLSKLFNVSIDDIVGNNEAKQDSNACHLEIAEGLAENGVNTKAVTVSDFTNKARIMAELKEIIILPKSKESLILQILNDDEKACGCKCELLSAFDELGIRRQSEVLSYIRGLLQTNPRAKTYAVQKNSKPESQI